MKNLSLTALLSFFTLATASANVDCIGVFYDKTITLAGPVTFNLTRETKLSESTQFFRTKYNSFTYTASVNLEKKSISAIISGLGNAQGGSDDVSGRGGFGEEGLFEINGSKAGNIMFPSSYVAIQCELKN
ncbi:MAG: hypothetical protein K2Q18_06415 [Bdellovibrionales bacterium]|nr:hypothetical protein [Bdellovibrionales bacterium]